MTRVNEVDTISITDMALPAALGVGRVGDLVVFVPGGVPGDRLRVRIARVEKRLAYGEILEIEEFSPFREKPRCVHAGECEGSDLQALAYEKQLEIKENHLRQVLRRIGGPGLAQIEISPIVPSVDRFFYRSKIEFSFGLSDAETVVGMTERASPLRPFNGRIVPVGDCCLFSPAVGRILPVVRDFVRASGLRAFDKRTGSGELKRLVLREAKQTGNIMVNVVTSPGSAARLATLAKTLTDETREVKSVYATEEGHPMLLSGSAYIEERLAHLSLRVYPLSFFQPNPKAAEELCQRIVSAADVKRDEKLLGLYCGAGAIELSLAPHASEVTGIDSSAESISCARENAEINGVKNAFFLRDRAEKAASGYRGKGVNTVVVDPPRAGLSPEALLAVKEIRPEKIVYVSCNPSTLARDLKAVGDEYAPKRMIPFDFFPQTAHFEVLTILEKR